jgi:hypothetical protein
MPPLNDLSLNDCRMKLAVVSMRIFGNREARQSLHRAVRLIDDRLRTRVTGFCELHDLQYDGCGEPRNGRYDANLVG